MKEIPYQDLKPYIRTDTGGVFQIHRQESIDILV